MRKLLAILLLATISLFAQKWDAIDAPYEDFTSGGIDDTVRFHFRDTTAGSNGWAFAAGEMNYGNFTFQTDISKWQFASKEIINSEQDTAGITSMLVKNYNSPKMYHQMSIWQDILNYVTIKSTTPGNWILETCIAGVLTPQDIMITDFNDAPIGLIAADRRMRYKLVYARSNDTAKVFYWSHVDQVWKQGNIATNTIFIDFEDNDLLTVINSTGQNPTGPTEIIGYVDSVNVWHEEIFPPVPMLRGIYLK